jgi:N-acetylmuramic acid 6-phosphate etherase
MTRITESLNPKSKGIEESSLRNIVGIINSLDSEITGVIETQLDKIAEAAKLVMDTIKSGGRVFCIGAGSSGRIGFLEATEIPPTYGLSPEKFQAIIAGGLNAVWSSIESAEDNEEDGGHSIEENNIGPNDLIIAIAASGSTPFVIGAVKRAKELGTIVVSITNNPDTILSRISNVSIEAVVGPELVAGSTRMRAGTAQKMILNMISTAAMIKLGYVYDGYMVGVKASNQKLKERAKRIIMNISGVSEQKAGELLEAANGDVRVSMVTLLTKLSMEEASEALQKEGSLRQVLKNRGIQDDT